MRKDRLYRVAVIGGGPAGCAAAFGLTQSAIDTEVVLLERGTPGKDKACGDALVPSSVALLNRFGIDRERLSALNGLPIHRVDLKTRDSLLWQAEWPDTGWMVRRSALDQALRDVVSRFAAIRYGTEVTAITGGSHGGLTLTLRDSRETGSHEVEFDAVVIAAGSGSALARERGIDGRPTMAASISAYADISSPPAPIFEFGEAYRPGYAWIFPITHDLANVGICALSSENVKPLRRLATEYLTELVGTARVRWRGGSEPLWSGAGNVWHHASGIVSCGDSAGLVNPTNGEGITAALASGERAGAAISAYLSEGRQSQRLKEYSRWVADYFSAKYARKPSDEIWSLLGGKGH